MSDRHTISPEYQIEQARKVKRLEAKNSKLRAEVAKLREVLPRLVQDAYVEGFDDGADHDNIDWKYPPLGIAWLQSHARDSIGFPAINPEQKALIDRWYEAKVGQGEDVPLEALAPAQRTGPRLVTHCCVCGERIDWDGSYVLSQDGVRHHSCANRSNG